MELKLIIEALQKSKLTFDIQHCKYETLIGVKLSLHCWTWFKFCDFTKSLSFDHTYSQNTGKSERGILKGLNKISSLEKRIGLKLN